MPLRQRMSTSVPTSMNTVPTACASSAENTIDKFCAAWRWGYRTLPLSGETASMRTRRRKAATRALAGNIGRRAMVAHRVAYDAGRQIVLCRPRRIHSITSLAQHAPRTWSPSRVISRPSAPVTESARVAEKTPSSVDDESTTLNLRADDSRAASPDPKKNPAS